MEWWEGGLRGSKPSRGKKYGEEQEREGRSASEEGGSDAIG